ncbi:alkyl hydroperoxide reductase [Dictyobacter alpinus]|uniref:thioredoxin-dependent peroxiredoxin n=1 Tax=Dictyobacter alpinus TaxID=2014873 RepID=A0A402BBE4_9CHLR|nr:peroxiredoxin-like family protein [Dictyobacter alpinus]GCE28597.1 alkyl hydroperoxide reductase [Dictyobacter alpinus]
MTTAATLEQQINEFKSQMARQAPAEVRSRIDGLIDDLVKSGMAKSGLKVGQKAPEFTLPNPLGEQIELARLLKEGPVVVTFYRGEWCPYCNLQLHAYQQIMPQIKELGATLVAISPQTADHSLSMTEKHALTFHVLSDAGNAIARQYGLVYSLNEQIRPLFTQIGSDLPTFNADNSWELPMPGTFIIDQDGTIRLAQIDADFTHRLEPASILDGLRALNK